MARGSLIVLEGNPKGVFLEGTIGDTSKPGTCMQVKPATALTGGRATYISTNIGTAGYPALLAILDLDMLQGKGATDAYVSGTRGGMYCPIAGEDLNVLVGVGGGPQTFTIGDKLMLNSTTGVFIPYIAASLGMPWIVMETITITTIPSLVFCKFTGSN